MRNKAGTYLREREMVYQCLATMVEVADVKGGELILSDGHVLGKGSLGLPDRNLSHGR